ncbi:cation transporter [Halobellus sp. Atlit-38R]|jgi:copper chaperone|uniref:heavy-metal-associated domain-containing protein n=1 Tax=Halobellus sp. Atlit-38R TaxID=2282131 RepID=UPI000EF1B7B9|nr:cation transporter [Halobellus sp. Atlit-38R]RLM90342.1 cation transporter [Halobellus sp. Atlit-38R]
MSQTQTLTVEGMSCGHCEQTVEDTLLSVSGVESAEADRESNAVTVEGDAAVANLVAAVNDAGYDASA